MNLCFFLHWPKGGSIPSFQGHCWKWCHFMYFSKLDDYFVTWKTMHILTTPGFQLLYLVVVSGKCDLWKTKTGTATEHGWAELTRIGEFQTHCLHKFPCPMVWIVQCLGDNYKLELLKRTLLRWKSIHSLTPEYWIFMELSHNVVYLCVWPMVWFQNISCFCVC
jgi:hypothetical protein